MTIKETLKSARVSASDAARLVGVSRVTMGYWVNERRAPSNPVLIKRLNNLLERLQAATERGDLPIKPRPSDTAERLRILSEILVRAQ